MSVAAGADVEPCSRRQRWARRLLPVRRALQQLLREAMVLLRRAWAWWSRSAMAAERVRG